MAALTGTCRTLVGSFLYFFLPVCSFLYTTRLCNVELVKGNDYITRRVIIWFQVRCCDVEQAVFHATNFVPLC
jgi:hypothetical protein